MANAVDSVKWPPSILGVYSLRHATLEQLDSSRERLSEPSSTDVHGMQSAKSLELVTPPKL